MRRLPAILLVLLLLPIVGRSQTPPISPNSQSPAAALLVDPATGLPYSAGTTDSSSILPIANFNSPISVILIDPATGQPYKAGTGGGGGGSPGGSNYNLQYNLEGAFTGIGNGTLGYPLLSGGASAAAAFGQLDLTIGVTNVLPVANGGTGTSSPGLVAGTNVTITGSWPDQTINSSGGGGMVYPGAGIPISTGSAWGASITPGTGVATALGVSVGSAGAFVVNGGALGTPASGVATNLTGTASALNIGGTAAGLSATLAVGSGGTGLTAITSHDLIIGNGTSAATLLAPAATSGVPFISQGASANPAYGAINLAGGSSIVTGTLPVGNGGTGAATLTGVLKGNGTSAFSAAAAADVYALWSGTCSASTYLRGDGSCATPSGGGNVSNSGTPTSGQLAEWTSSTVIQGIGVGGCLTIASSTLTSTAGINAQTGTSYTIQTTDNCQLVNFNNASAVAVTLPQATGSFGVNFSFLAQNIGAGTVTITPTTSTINGSSTLTIAQNRGCEIVSDGTNWQVDSCNALVSGSGSPGGSTNAVQYNGGGSFSGLSLGAGQILQGNSGAPTATATPTLGVAGTTAGTLGLANTSGGVATLQYGSTASNNTYTLPASTGGTIALTNVTQTISGKNTFSGGIVSTENGAASTSPISITGSIFTGGTSTTTFPYLYDDQGATAPTTFSTAGTYRGINAVSGYTGNFLDYYVNGTRAFLLTYQGNITGGTYNGVTIPATSSTALTSPTTTTANQCQESTTTAGLGQWVSCSGGSAFSAITSATNTTAAMVVGTGASLAASGSGTIAATSLGALSGLPAQSADTIVANATGSSASPTAVAVSAFQMALLQASTKFTAAGTGCTVGTTAGGATAGTLTLATGPCTSIVITMNGATGLTAPTGWHCNVGDKTTQNAGTWIPQWGESSSTTTTATIAVPAAAGATDVLSFACSGY